VGIVGLTKRASTYTTRIQHHLPKPVIKFTAIFDERASDRIEEKYQHYLKGGIDEAVELAREGKNRSAVYWLTHASHRPY